MTFFRSSGSAARAYLEADHVRADDYYLAEGTGLADRTVMDGSGQVVALDSLNAVDYERWVDWVDPMTGEQRGKPRTRSVLDADTGEVLSSVSSPRFAEMTVNSDKTLSIAAALNPEVSAALDLAQRDAARAMTSYMAEHSRTRVGNLGEQRLVPVELLESVAVTHQTSRAGDPHRHVHLQWSTRVFAEGKWRGLDTATTLRQQGALRGVGEAVINAHPVLREALGRAGFTFDPSTGKVVELEPFAAGMSKRAEQVSANRDQLEAAWRTEHPGQVPGPALVRSFDRQAWALGRPDKKPTELATEDRWIAELREAGYRHDPTGRRVSSRSVTDLDREALAAEAVQRAAQQRSAWSVADLHDIVGHQVAASGVTAAPEVIREVIADVSARAVAQSRSMSDPTLGVIPEALRHLTSAHVIEVQDEVNGRLAARAVAGGVDARTTGNPSSGVELGEGQQRAVDAMSGSHSLVVIEGAAGTGKTTVLRAAKTVLERDGRRQMIVAPTLKAAKEAAAATGSDTASLHKLLHEHGWRWNEVGEWTRLQPGQEDPQTGRAYQGPAEAFRLDPRSQLVVDEAGMVDQDTARALLRVVDERGASLVLMGDRAQLAAIGRGGVLDSAVRLTGAHVDLDEVHRFVRDGQRDEDYAALSLQMRDRRDPGAVFDQLLQRGQISVHRSPEEAVAAIAAEAVDAWKQDRSTALTVPTNREAAQLNEAVRLGRVNEGTVDNTRTVPGSDELPIGRGDVVMTRLNDAELGLANRETFTVVAVRGDGSLTLADESGRRHTAPAKYVREHLHLGYAVTGHGNQGATRDIAHVLMSDATDAAGAYVGLSRGRTDNVAHLVAVDVDDARAQFVDTFARERGDRGLEAARADLAEQIKGYVLEPTPSNARGVTHEHSPVVQRELEHWTAQAEQVRKQIEVRQRIIDRAARVQAWEAAGRPKPAETDRAATSAQQALTKAQEQARVAQAVTEKQLGLTQTDATREARAHLSRVEVARHKVDQAGILQRRSARAEYEQISADVEARYARPLPSPGTEAAWAAAIGDEARAAAAAAPNPTLDRAAAELRAAYEASQRATQTADETRDAWSQTIEEGRQPLPEAGYTERWESDQLLKRQGRIGADHRTGEHDELAKNIAFTRRISDSRPAAKIRQEESTRDVLLYSEKHRPMIAAEQLPPLEERLQRIQQHTQRLETADPAEASRIAQKAQLARRAEQDKRRAAERAAALRAPDNAPQAQYRPPEIGHGHDRGPSLGR